MGTAIDMAFDGATLAACPRFERFVLTSLKQPGYLVEVVLR